MPAFVFEAVAADDPDAQRCLLAFFTELDATFPSGFDPDAWGALTAEDTEPPSGRFLIARLDGEAVGCGALRRLADEVIEIKRMWVSPALRGKGLGRELLCELERGAAEMGCCSIRLDTNLSLGPAISMYEAAGYSRIEPYNDNPYAGAWFEKCLPWRT